MKASWEKIEKNTVLLTVEVNAEQVADALDKAFKKVSAKVNVPGFRQGKVPRALFEKKFGVESLYQDALDILLPEAYVSAVKETGIEPVDRPDVDIQQIAKGQPLQFTAKVTVKPEVELGAYKGIDVEIQASNVTDEEVADELNRLQQRHAELTVIEEGPALNGDTVSIDFEGFADGEPFEGGKAEKYSLELGSNSFIPGFEEQVVGLQVGEEKDVSVTFPEDYHAVELKGKPALFKVKLQGIKRKNLPALDDEFAKDVSEFETFEEFKHDIVKRLEERKKQANDRELENTLVEKAAEAASVEIPSAMIDSEVEQIYEDFVNRLKSQGFTLELYQQITGQDEAAMKGQMRGDAEKRVRHNLVLEAIAKAENIETTEDDLTQQIEQLAKSYQRTADEIRAILSANGSLESMKRDLVVRKTLDFLIENSNKTTTAA